jgi:peptidoglycan hydrolase-like protein with peptidoglycan-binding domain
MLKLGSTGQAVIEWQRVLGINGLDVAIDGQFGPLTEAATRELQARLGITADGVVGPATRAALERAERGTWPDVDPRQRIVEAAAGEIGPGRVADYWASCGVKPPYPKHWCGAFCLWALHQAGLALDVKWVVGKGFVGGERQVRIPEPGDVAYYHSPYQHHAIVERVELDVVHTIDGNQPDVRRRVRRLRDGVYFSIGRWVG